MATNANLIKVNDKWVSLQKANTELRKGNIDKETLLSSWNSRIKDREGADPKIKEKYGWDTADYKQRVLEAEEAKADPMLSAVETKTAFPEINKGVSLKKAEALDVERGKSLANIQQNIASLKGEQPPMQQGGARYGFLGKLEDIEPTKEFEGGFGGEESRYGFTGRPEEKPKQSIEERTLGRQKFASELKEAMAGKPKSDLASLMTEDVRGKASELGLTTGQVGSFLKKEFGKTEMEQFKRDRDVRAKKFFEEMSQKRMSAQRRPTYSRFGELRRATQLRKRGFGRAADAVAARFALSPEAKAPAVASQAFLKERERIGEEARRAQGIKTRLTETLLRNLVGENKDEQGIFGLR